MDRKPNTPKPKRQRFNTGVTGRHSEDGDEAPAASYSEVLSSMQSLSENEKINFLLTMS